eukprot:144902_1
MSYIKTKKCRWLCSMKLIFVEIIVVFISVQIIILYVSHINDTKMNTFEIQTKNTSNICHWTPPYDKLREYKRFNKYFGKKYDLNITIKYIQQIFESNLCNPFEHGYILNFSNTLNNSFHTLNIAVTSIIILPNSKSNNIPDEIHVFKDIRTYFIKLANLFSYCQINGYSLILLTKRIFNYKYKANITYNNWMKGATYQKPFLLNKFLSYYDWILYVDYDTIFVHCINYRIEDIIINHAYYLHNNNNNNNNNNTISIILGGERFATINAGVFIIKNNEWSHKFLSNWMYIENNAEKYQLLKVDNVHRDQPLFVALLQGFDINRDITNSTPMDLRYHNDLAQKKYLEKRMKLNFDDMLDKPIWDQQFAEFAVSIDEAIINAKTQHFNKGKADELDLDISFLCYAFLLEIKI